MTDKLRIAALKERAAGEARVCVTPETVKKFTNLGAIVAVESGAGHAASIADADYAAVGAIMGDAASVVAGADIVLGVQGPDVGLLSGAKPGVWVAAGLDPFGQRGRVDAYAVAGIEALAMEFMPRITRAQSMDILSSQSNLAGYKAVIDAAGVYGRAFPMMMTAAGTISAAKAFIMGVGVAGLQAIATARRLGAQVSATDVRSATKEQIQSLGAKPIFVENVAGIEGEGAGGYATEMSPEYQAAQAELVSSHIAKQDIVITTALIPGRPAPVLVTAEQVASMKPGSVLIDLAVEQGGNVAGAKPDQTVVTENGVKIIGFTNLPSAVAADASALYSRNLVNLAALLIKDGTLTPDWDDEILKAAVVAKDGAVVHPALQ